MLIARTLNSEHRGEIKLTINDRRLSVTDFRMLGSVRLTCATACNSVAPLSRTITTSLLRNCQGIMDSSQVNLSQSCPIFRKQSKSDRALMVMGSYLLRPTLSSKAFQPQTGVLVYFF